MTDTVTSGQQLQARQLQEALSGLPVLVQEHVYMHMNTLVQMGRDIAAGDAAATASPMWTVQRLARVYVGSKYYGSDYEWVDAAGEIVEDDQGLAMLESTGLDEVEWGPEPPYEKRYYKLQWEHHKTFVTERAAKDYIQQRSNSADAGGALRLYVDAGTWEWRNLQRALLGLHEIFKPSPREDG